MIALKDFTLNRVSNKKSSMKIPNVLATIRAYTASDRTRCMYIIPFLTYIKVYLLDIIFNISCMSVRARRILPVEIFLQILLSSIFHHILHSEEKKCVQRMLTFIPLGFENFIFFFPVINFPSFRVAIIA